MGISNFAKFRAFSLVLSYGLQLLALQSSSCARIYATKLYRKALHWSVTGISSITKRSLNSIQWMLNGRGPRLAAMTVHRLNVLSERLTAWSAGREIRQRSSEEFRYLSRLQWSFINRAECNWESSRSSDLRLVYTAFRVRSSWVIRNRSLADKKSWVTDQLKKLSQTGFKLFDNFGATKAVGV